MSFSSRISEPDGKAIKKLLRQVKRPGQVDVGIIDPKKRDEGGELNTAEIGFTHEFGVEVPERSFLRSTMHEERKRIVAQSRKFLKAVVRGKLTVDKGLGLLGIDMADKVSQKIVKIRKPPNSPATLAAKAPKTNPLVDTGQLKNSITHRVRK